ncbi:Replicase RepFR55 [Bacillus thuringiensis]|uniref:Replicase RepFR55 n=1 Tax=Bacillus thuringiensis TaxID=1428 RepID=UPI000BFAB088|nr:Replicase RepFR55 [Bacillus thuringiensis]PFW05316.1 Replicase RepFR55 [Bacillus thuringiensis]
METVQNFVLSKAKKELSPRIKQLPKKKGAINRAIQSVIKDIDSILLENCEGVTTQEHLSPRRYKALQVVLSFLVREGYSQVKQNYISKKSGISKPLIIDTFKFLEDLEVCHQIKVRRHGKVAPSVYVLTLHNNYLKIVEYFKEKWAYIINVYSTFTDFLKRKITKKNNKSVDLKKEDISTCTGLDVFTSEPEKQTIENELPTNEEDKHYYKRLKDLYDYLSEGQKRVYHHLKSEMTYLSEKDAYSIANRVSRDIDEQAYSILKSIANGFKHNKATYSNPAYFMKIYEERLSLDLKRRYEKANEKFANLGQKFSQPVPFYNWLEETK